MNPAQAITTYQPLLHAIAYNIVRCKQDAEDIVQETFAKWLSVDRTAIDNTKAYLIRSVVNNCRTHLETLKKKKEEYLDAIQVKDLILKFKESSIAHIDIEAELSRAFKVMHAKLEPIERAVYVLKEVLDFDYEAIQETLNKKKDHCRQLFCRARKKLAEETSKVHFELPDTTKLVSSFKQACEKGHIAEFINELKKDISRALS